MVVEWGERCFSGVYKKRYVSSVKAPSRPVSRLAPHQSSRKPMIESISPNSRASCGVMRPEGMGRLRVRGIFASATRSYH